MKKLITFLLFIVASNINAQIKTNPIIGDTIYIPGKIIHGGYFIDKLTLDDNKATGTGLIVTGGGGSKPMATFTRDVGTTGPEITLHGNSGHATQTYSWNTYEYSIGTTTGNKFRIADHTNLAGTGLRLELDSSGNFDFQAGNLTTTGDVTAASFDAGGTGTDVLLDDGTTTPLASINGIYTNQKVSISSAQFLSSNTTPIELVAAPGAGKLVRIMNVSINFDYLGTAYTAASGLEVIYTGETNALISFNNLLNVTADVIKGASGSTISTQLENTAIELRAVGADPETGTGTADVIVTYEIIDL